MKKFFAAVLTVLVIVLFGGISAAPAQAEPTSVSVDVAKASVAKAAPGFVLEKVSPSTAIAPPKNLGGSGGIKPAWLYVSCYWAMNGYRYCYRYSCTYFEKVALGCYEGWYRVPTPIYV